MLTDQKPALVTDDSIKSALVLASILCLVALAHYVVWLSLDAGRFPLIDASSSPNTWWWIAAEGTLGSTSRIRQP